MADAWSNTSYKQTPVSQLWVAAKSGGYHFDYDAERKDELTFTNGQSLSVVRKGDKTEKLWWWAKRGKQEGYIPRNLLGVSV